MASIALVAATMLITSSARAQVFVADWDSASVNTFDATGNLQGTFVSTGSGGLAAPQGMRFGPDGNLYITYGAYNGQPAGVKKYSGHDGSFLGTFVSGMPDASDIVFDNNGHAYVTDIGSDKVYQYNSSGQLLQTYSNGLSSPRGIAWDEAHHQVLVTNDYRAPYANSVTAIDPNTGAWSTFATGLGEPEGITAGPDGKFYVANFTYSYSFGGQSPPDTIQVIGANGGVSSTWSSGGTINGAVELAAGFNRMYVTNIYSHQVEAFNFETGQYDLVFNAGHAWGIAVREAPLATPEPGNLVIGSALSVIGFVQCIRKLRKPA